jgi:hypothetical protein
MLDPQAMIEKLVLKNMSRMSALLNSDATKRWYWATLQAEGMFTITETITELQSIQEILDVHPDWNREGQEGNFSALGMYMTQLDRVWYDHKSKWNNWSNRQLTIMKEGGPIFGPPPSVEEAEEAFFDTISYSGAHADENSPPIDEDKS